MDPKSLRLLQAAAGHQGTSYDPLGYVDDVAAWGQYTGTGNSNSPAIYNGLDMSSTNYGLSGGSMWAVNLEGAGNTDWGIYDTVRGQVNSDRYKLLQSNYDNPTVTHANFHLGSFNNTGGGRFQISDSSECNGNGGQYSWTCFRRRAKFHDVVRYQGSGSAKTVAHDLGTKPGFIIIKDDSEHNEWTCYHSHLNGGTNPEQYYIHYNNGDSNADVGGEVDSSSRWNDTAPTSTNFTVGDSDSVNKSGNWYMAYIFAGCEEDGGYGENSDESIIKTGEYTGSLTETNIVDCGFVPGWVMIKRRDAGAVSPWLMMDDTSMWGRYPNSNSQTASLERKSCNWGESSNGGICMPITSSSGGGKKGFTHANLTDNDYNGSGQKYIYIAIRKLGQKPATASTTGTDLFNTSGDSGDNGTSKQDPLFVTNFQVDMAWAGQYNGGDKYFWSQRIANQQYFYPFQNSSLSSHFTYEYNFKRGFCETAQDFSNWEANCFARRKHFFNSQVYIGTGSAQTIPHELGTIPQLLMIKNTGTGYLTCKLNNTNDAFYMTNAATQTGTGWWNDTAATATDFTVGNENEVNQLNSIFYVYMWGDKGAKCGTYTGNTSSGVTVSDVGFQPRGLIIRRTNAGENWIWINHARGMTSGFQYLSSQSAYSTSYSLASVNSNGFTISSGTTNTHINHNGSTYFYMALK